MDQRGGVRSENGDRTGVRRGRAVVGSRMRAAMREANLSIGEVADRLNCARTTVHRWFSGDRAPSAYLLEQFARLVNKPAAHFWADPAEDRNQQRFSDVVRVLNHLAAHPHATGLEAAAAVIGPLDSRTSEAEQFKAVGFRAFQAELEIGAVRLFARGWRQLTHAQRVALLIELAADLAPE